MTNDSARHLQRWEDTMERYVGNMEFNIYASEQHCPRSTDVKKRHFYSGSFELSCTLLDVPHECPMRNYNAFCKIPKYRSLIGDHVKKDDVVVEGKNGKTN
jgi:hypothetical protein